MSILALDVGTTSIRGIIVDEKGRFIDEESRQTPLVYKDGFIEQSPEAYRERLLDICQKLSANNSINAISVTGFRSAPMLIGANGEELTNFIMWQDTRNRDIANSLKPMDDFVFKRSGARINTVFTATKIAWFKRHMSEVYNKAAKALIVPDYLIYLMTGELTSDYTYGSRTHLMNIKTLKWDDELCELFGVDMDKLCELRPQGSIVGTVTQSFSDATGIALGTPVISAGGDQQCGALGLGVLSCDTMEVNSGTGSFVISLSDEAQLDNPNMICNVAAIPGKYIVESNIISSASALNWLIEEYFPELARDGIDFSLVNSIAASTPMGANGLYCLPHFQGCGTRDWNPDARAAFWGFSLASHRRDMIRALYEGIACEIAKSVDTLPEICRKARRVYIAGGLCKSEPFVRILADALDRALCRHENIQATATGAFISASVAVGLYSDYQSALEAVHGDDVSVIRPDREAHAFYLGYMDETERVYGGLKG